MLWLQVDRSPTWGKLDDAIRSLKADLSSNPSGMFICTYILLSTCVSYKIIMYDTVQMKVCVHSQCILELLTSQYFVKI